MADKKGIFKKDVYIANMGEAGPGLVQVVFREGDPLMKSDPNNPPPARTTRHDLSLVFPFEEVPGSFGDTFTIEIKER